MFNKDDSQVGVVLVKEIVLVVRASLSSSLDVGISHLTGLGDVLTAEVEHLRRKSRLVDPRAPVNQRKNSVDLSLINGLANKGLPSGSKLLSLDRSLLMIQNVLSKEGLEVVLTNQALQVCQ